jgi:hypothetical protein
MFTWRRLPALKETMHDSLEQFLVSCGHVALVIADDVDFTAQIHYLSYISLSQSGRLSLSMKNALTIDSFDMSNWYMTCPVIYNWWLMFRVHVRPLKLSCTMRPHLYSRFRRTSDRPKW